MRRTRRKREKYKKKIIVISVFLFLIIMTSGYAAFSTNISLHAKGNIKCHPEIAKDKLLKTLTTVGDGLYKDKYEAERYVYKGASPNNYIEFNNEKWRIISLENDGTLKIYKSEEFSVPFDKEGVRDYTSNGAGGTYCSFYYSHGCNAWASNSNLVGSPSTFGTDENKGTVLKDATLNTYLNNYFYNGLSKTVQDQIVTHNFYVGPVKWYIEETNLNNLIKIQSKNEKKYIWNGKIGILSYTDILKSNIENTNCIMVHQENSEDMDYVNCNLNVYMDQLITLLNPTDYAGNIATFNNNNMINDSQPYRMRKIPIAIFLKNDLKLCGSGTESNPYTIVS